MLHFRSYNEFDEFEGTVTLVDSTGPQSIVNPILIGSFAPCQNQRRYSLDSSADG